MNLNKGTGGIIDLKVSIDELKEFLLKKGLCEEEITPYLFNIDKAIKEKKYGLVWEEKEDSISGISNDKVIQLKEVEERCIITDIGKPINILIEGDNIEALIYLQSEYKSSVNIIFLDPPYNTQNKGFKYNDTYIDKNDKWLHSEWLSFMNKRLLLAKELLSKDGLLFITIDSNEFAELKMLCDEVFGVDNLINIVTLRVRTNSGAYGGGGSKKLKKNTEYLLIYAKSIKHCKIVPPKKETNLMDIIHYNRANDIAFYYIRAFKSIGDRELVTTIEDGSGGFINIYRHFNYEYVNLRTIMLNECLTEEEAYLKYYEGVFMVTNSQSSIVSKVNDVVDSTKDLISYDYVPIKGKDKGIKTTKYIWNNTLVVWLKDTVVKRGDTLLKTETLGTLWDDISYGRIDLEGGVSFKNGKKPLELLKRIIGMHSNKDGVILDFFAGSGTTGHAVMSLNKEDGGNRKFILCTNNENKICEEITYKRLSNAINGYTTKTRRGREVDGLGGNLKYYKTEVLVK